MLISLLPVKLTGILNNFFSEFAKVATFELLPTEISPKGIASYLSFLPDFITNKLKEKPDINVFDLVMQYEQSEPYNQRFEDMTFETKSLIKTLGFTFIVLLISGVEVLLFLVCVIVLCVNFNCTWVQRRYY